MKKYLLLTLVAAALVFAVVKVWAQPSQSTAIGRYEYVSIRHMGGDKTTVHWPDGKISKIYELTELRRPKEADERLWCLNMIVNLLAKQGYEPVDMPTLNRDANDIWMRRSTPHP